MMMNKLNKARRMAYMLNYLLLDNIFVGIDLGIYNLGNIYQEYKWDILLKYEYKLSKVFNKFNSSL